MKSAADVGVKTYHKGILMINELMTIAHSRVKFTCSPQRHSSLAATGIVSAKIEIYSVARGEKCLTHLEGAAYPIVSVLGGDLL